VELAHTRLADFPDEKCKGIDAGNLTGLDWTTFSKVIKGPQQPEGRGGKGGGKGGGGKGGGKGAGGRGKGGKGGNGGKGGKGGKGKGFGRQ
jgi:hypothetical protein